MDLHKVELVNQFSRTIARQPMDAAEAEQCWPKSMNPSIQAFGICRGGGVGTAAFTVLFGGCVTHFLSGIVVGNPAVLLWHLNQIRLDYFTINLLGAAQLLLRLVVQLQAPL